jgi:hypothetical protein
VLEAVEDGRVDELPQLVATATALVKAVAHVPSPPRRRGSRG